MFLWAQSRLPNQKALDYVSRGCSQEAVLKVTVSGTMSAASMSESSRSLDAAMAPWHPKSPSTSKILTPYIYAHTCILILYTYYIYSIMYICVCIYLYKLEVFITFVFCLYLDPWQHEAVDLVEIRGLQGFFPVAVSALGSCLPPQIVPSKPCLCTLSAPKYALYLHAWSVVFIPKGSNVVPFWSVYYNP